ncbi:MAG: hypothetical protein K8S54_21105 [Spirochaetia bacterium]|nr:hypothetical protein [Spirochaetia bacterium]
MGSLALITLLGFVVNFSYIHAFIKLKQANLALGRGETELAYQHVQGAIVLVPNSKDLELIAPMYQGIMLMSKGDSQGALEPFRRFAKNFPQDEGARRFLLEAQAGAYFDQHNYPGFFQASQELARLYPEDPFMLMQESSAAACMYAVTSMEVYKKLSLLFLAEAHKRLRADDENARVYEARINHRLNTREIISSREFEERFGHGEAK